MIVTLLTALVTASATLVSFGFAGLSEATAPEVDQVPRPSEWSRRKLDTPDCTGNSTGEECVYIVLSPTGELTRSEAQASYRRYLEDEGWTSVSGFRRSFERGAEGEQLILVVGSDSEFAYSANVSSGPPEENEILVNASFADWGEAQRDRDAVRFAIIALALTFVPALVMLLLRRKRERHNLHVAASDG